MENRNKIISVLLTLAIIGVLMFSGPVSAVIINANAPNSVEEGSTATIDVDVDIENQERLPVAGIKVVVTKDGYYEECAIDAAGNKQTCSGDFGSVSVNKAVGFSTGARWGYGYSFGYGNDPSTATWQNITSYTDGYGYGYVSSSAELSYSIQWKAPYTTGSYNVEVYARASDGATDYVYTSDATETIDVVSGGGGSSDDGSTENESETDVSASATVVFNNIQEGQKIGMNVLNDNIAFNQVMLVVGESSQQLNLNVQSLADKPDDVGDAAATRVYQYLDVDTGGASVDQADIDFKVSRDWLSENGLDSGQVSLYHYNTGWEELNTQILSSDNEYVYYSAQTPSFSYFAVGEGTTQLAGSPSQDDAEQEEDTTGQQDDTQQEDTGEQQDDTQQDETQQEDTGGQQEETQQDDKQQKDTGQEDTQPDDKQSQKKDGNAWLWAVVLLVAVVAIAGGYYLFQKK